MTQKLAKLISGLSSPFVTILVFGLWLIASFSYSLEHFVMWAGLFFLFVIFLPLVYILIGVKRGIISDIHVAVREQRALPFALASIGSTILLILYVALGVPREIIAMAAAVLVSGLVFGLISSFWKISIHAAAYTGGVVIIASLLNPHLAWLLLGIPLIMWARLTRKRHDFWQSFAAVIIVSVCALTATRIVMGRPASSEVLTLAPTPTATPSPSLTATPTATATPTPSPEPTATPTAKPSPSATTTASTKFTLSVPFSSQSPLQTWDEVHEDACEEASLLMVERYLSGKAIGSAQERDDELTELVHLGESFGQGKSIALQDLIPLADNYYPEMPDGVLHRDATIESIKAQLNAKKPVIIGAAGKLLHNPNFKDGGPEYHMLVIIGYDADGFITNDPGTRLGASYRYSYATVMNALHDWDADNIMNGEKNFMTF